MKRVISILLAVFLLIPGVAFPDGGTLKSKTPVKYSSYLEAYDKGDYIRAFNLAEPLAKQGDAKAQYYVALMYDTGKVPLDHPDDAVMVYKIR
jgi:TPR repeat protein